MPDTLISPSSSNIAHPYNISKIDHWVAFFHRRKPEEKMLAEETLGSREKTYWGVNSPQRYFCFEIWRELYLYSCHQCLFPGHRYKNGCCLQMRSEGSFSCPFLQNVCWGTLGLGLSWLCPDRSSWFNWHTLFTHPPFLLQKRILIIFI